MSRAAARLTGMDTDTTHTANHPIRDLLWAATRTWGFDARLDAATLADLLPWLPDVQHLADQMLDDCLTDLWTQGWTPADVVHVVARRLSRSHVAAASLRIVADDARRRASGQPLDPRWAEQTADLPDIDKSQPPLHADERLRQALDVLALIRLLPSVPFTMPRPGDPLTGTTAAGRLDNRTLRRVRALLAEAESTDFEEEAHAFAAKAQELMARHSIDEARLHADDDVGEPSLQRILLEGPYLDAKASVVSAVAAANRCRTVLSPGLGWVTVVDILDVPAETLPAEGADGPLPPWCCSGRWRLAGLFDGGPPGKAQFRWGDQRGNLVRRHPGRHAVGPHPRVRPHDTVLHQATDDVQVHRARLHAVAQVKPTSGEHGQTAFRRWPARRGWPVRDGSGDSRYRGGRLGRRDHAPDARPATGTTVPETISTPRKPRWCPAAARCSTTSRGRPLPTTPASTSTSRARTTDGSRPTAARTPA